MRLLPVFGVVVTLAACGDPLSGVDRLADVDVAPTDAAAAALPDASEVAREGFLGTSAATGTNAAATAAAQPARANGGGGFLRGLIRRAADADPANAIAADVAQSQAAQPAPQGTVIETVPTTPSAAGSADAPVELAALPQEPAKPRRGLFGGGNRNKARTGPDARDVPFGTVLGFGEIARVCEARGKALGKKLAGQGRRGFNLHDSAPGVRSKRTFYITGFDDNCPRQFTAANALLGTPSFYEALRFSPAGKHQPRAAIDAAYDEIKSSVCRTAKTQPCGARIEKLDAQVAFVSAYEFGEYNGQWKEFLVHDGTVVASAVKSR